MTAPNSAGTDPSSALAELEEALRDAALDAIILIDGQGAIVGFNPAAERTFGLERAQAVGQDLADLIIPPAYRAAYHQALACYLSTENGPVLSHRLELLALRADGGEFPAELTITAIGTPTAPRFSCAIRDISERRKAAATMRRQSDLIGLLQRVAVAANSEDDVRPVLQHTLDDVCVLTGWPIGHAYILPDGDGDTLVSSGIWHLDDPEAFGVFRGITEAMPLARGIGLPGRVFASGRPLWVVDVTKDANFPRARAATDIGVRAGFGFPIMVGPRVEGVMEFFSPLAIEPDDAWLDVVQQIGYVVGRVIERRRARQALEQALTGEHLARERAEVATRSRDEVLATVSHDLQNPLHTIVLAAALAEHQAPGPSGECLRKQMSVIRRAVKRMSGLIRDLLDAALIDAGQLLIEPQAVPAHELLDEAAAMMRLHADERSIALVVTAEPGLPSVQGDRGRLLQVLANLLDNAVKFTPVGGIVTLQAVRSGAAIEFSVADTGPGIEPALQVHLFDRFWRAGGRDKAGTGLGLAIAKGIVEAHGGRIGIDSRPGAGSRLFFTVPAA